MELLVVQLKRDEVILATFRKKKGAVSFVSAERHPLKTPGELGDILKRAVSPTERKVILALPPELLFLRELELPITDREKVRGLLPLELKGETVLETDEVVFDALPLAEGKVLAVWGRIKALSEAIEKLHGAGLEPEVVTASLFHWSRLAPAAGTTVVTDGEAVAAFRNRIPLYFRAMPQGAGEGELARTIAALEIAKGIKVEQLVSYAATGVASLQPTPELAGAFGEDTHAARDLAGAYAVAAAAADGSILNLRRGPLAYTAGTAKLYKRLRLTMILAAALVLLTFAETGVRYYLAQRDLTSLENSVQSIYRQAFPTRKKSADAVGELRAEIRKLEGAKTSSNLLKLLKDLAEVKGDDITGFYETEVDGAEVRLKGDARNFQAANDFKNRAPQLFENGEVSETKSRPDGSVTFSFRGKLKGVAR